MNAPEKKCNSNQYKSLILFAHVLICMILIFCLIHSKNAHAVDLNIPSISEMVGSTGEGDVFKVAIEGVFGGFGRDPIGSIGTTTTLLGDIATTYNVIILGFLTAGLIWALIAFIVKGASSGDDALKGPKTAWMPVRIGAGVIGSLPVFAGFNLFQALLMLATLAGIGAANMLLDTALNATENLKAITPSISSATSAPNLSSEMKMAMGGLFVSELCRRSQNYTEQPHGAKQPESKPIQDDTEAGWDYGGCGKVTIVSRENADLRGDSSLMGFRTAAVDYDGIAKSSRNAAIGALDKMQAIAAREAKAIINMYVQNSKNGTPELNVQMMPGVIARLMVGHRSTVDQLNNDIRALTSGAASGVHENVTDKIRERGWATLGSYYTVFSEVSAALADAQHAFAVEYRTGDIVKRAQEKIVPFTLLDGELKSYITQMGLRENIQDRKTLFDKVVENARPLYNPIGYIGDKGQELWDNSKNDLGNRSLGQYIVMSLASAVTDGSGGHGLVNPVIAAKNLGDFLMTVGQAGFGAGAVAQVFPAGRAVTLALDQLGVGPVLSAIFGTFIVIGMVLSTYVPLIMFLTWISAVIRYFCHIIQALFHAPVAALSHIHIDGDDYVRPGSGAHQYYFLLLDVFLRPSLMVIAFFVSSAALIFTGTWVLLLFSDAMAAAQGNSVTGLLSIVGYLLVFLVLMFTMIQTIANLINSIPDKVLALAGSGIGNTFDSGGTAIIGGAAAGAMMSGSGIAQAAGGVKLASKAAEPASKSSSGTAKSSADNNFSIKHST